MRYRFLIWLCFLLGFTLQMNAQNDETRPEDREVDMDNPTFEPMVKV